MTANPNTLVLDFGGVITRTLFETHELSEKTLGIPAGTLNWRGPFDPENDALWRSMQAGKITERNYWEIRTKEVSDLVGKDWQNMQDFVIAARSTNPMEIIRPEALAAIKSAKQAGCKLAILSNELDLFYG
ncbi:MAG: HAD family phosphatase, partial [Rhizobiaceae bacterium]|nr:HAD family phosphatase [Rhizobiaceae bacterium]